MPVTRFPDPIVADLLPQPAHIDVSRLALLPIAWLAEQPDPFDACTSTSVDERYRKVFRCSVWAYSLFVHREIVAGHFGEEAATAVQNTQQQLLSDDFPNLGESMERIFSLIRLSHHSQPLEGYTPPVLNGEQTLAISLLFNLPDSPEYLPLQAEAPDTLIGLSCKADLALAESLSRAREQMEGIFATVMQTPPRPGPGRVSIRT